MGIYEQEHLRATDPGYVDKRSAATKRQHEEISRLWKDVSAQLDLLSNLHFKPKRVKADDSMLAPQEVYRPGDEKRTGDIVVRKRGANVNKDELSREEKLRRRRREKERMKKAQDHQGKTVVNGARTGAAGTTSAKGKKSKAQEKADLLSDLQKGNVKVIDKKGELQDLATSKKAKRGARDAGQPGGGALKL